MNTRLFMGDQVPKASAAKRVSSKSIKNEIGHLLWKVGLRSEKKRTHEFKLAHGSGSSSKADANWPGVKTLNVEILIGHKVGLSSSYYKPTSEELFEEYRKAVPYLTVSEAEEVKLERNKKVEKMEERIQDLFDRMDKMEKQNMELRALVKRIAESQS